ncbi:hypothetical protein [Sulfuricella sp. T08]|uniref:hypothetical protein n=1 Tax=Sulfuricella sp. T08 TaxID=1632857 RepID=UPI0016788111|nr:hypothetical protein [Sulfuricella sp. T08]
MDSELGTREHYGFNQHNVFGWQLMSPEERSVHGSIMQSVKTYDECNDYQEKHHKKMEVQAKEQGVKLSEANNNACDRMKAKGFLK